MTVGMTQLRLDGVSKVFPRRGREGAVWALDGIDLSVQGGEFVSLLGPSGCGKSTLLGLVAGFDRPSSGHIWHDGAEVDGPDRRRTVVFQEYALFPWKTIQENVEFGLKARGIPVADRRALARDFIARVHLAGFEHRYPHEVSGGMKQRAAIARALAPNPDLLLMDEPFGALDAQTRVLLQEEVARLSVETKKTVLFVTHSIEEAVFLGDRVVVMTARPGRVRTAFAVPLGRPRGPEMRRDSGFVSLVQDLWESLKREWEESE